MPYDSGFKGNVEQIPGERSCGVFTGFKPFVALQIGLPVLSSKWGRKSRINGWRNSPTPGEKINQSPRLIAAL